MRAASAPLRRAGKTKKSVSMIKIKRCIRIVFVSDNSDAPFNAFLQIYVSISHAFSLI